MTSEAPPKNAIRHAAAHVHAADIVRPEPTSRQSIRQVPLVASQMQVP